jgi:pimeloyl-ACP methyl ester carboxylesterase
MTPTPAVNHRSRIFDAGLALALSALVALLGLTWASSAEAAKVTKGPAGDAFYQPPSKMPKGHGQAIWQHKSGGLVPLDNAASNKDILYTSKSTHGERIAVSGSVSVPEGKPPKGGWPVVSWAHGTTGVADVCAPTRNEVGGPAEGYVDYVNPELSEFLDDGYAVVRTDYEGLGTPGPHPYLIGKSEGRSVLDMVRAARDLDPRIGDRMVIAGHSQGGHAALWAGAFAQKWTPELELDGTISYSPGSHLKLQAELLPNLTAPSSLTALATLVLYGVNTANPGIDPQTILSDEVLAFFGDVEETCLQQLGRPDSLGGIPPSELIREGAKRELAYGVLDKNNPDVTTGAPVLLLQGTADTTVLPVLSDMLANELEGNGDPFDYVKYDGVDHGGIVAAAQPDAIDFLEQQMPAR